MFNEISKSLIMRDLTKFIKFKDFELLIECLTLAKSNRNLFITFLLLDQFFFLYIKSYITVIDLL